MNTTPPKILIIDDEPQILSTCSKMLKIFQYEAFTTSDPRFALELIQNQKLDLVICDLLMPEMDGMEFIKQAGDKLKNIPVVIFSAYGTIDRAVACMKAGAFDFIEKPFEADHFRVVIDKALSYSRLFNERNNLLQQLQNKYKFENIIGNSAAIQNIFDIIESVAVTEANILITGESGTGKELIARSIHAHSKRKTGPFVPVNCGALPDNLFETEIFGHEAGAYTGAGKQKIGLMEFANGGSFFLDEICELPLSLQPKLLRVLQDKQLRRLGGNELIQIDLRLISATNRDPESFLAKNLIREDLYYRLNVINIHIPPLRERKEDIRLLADHFLKKRLEMNDKVIADYSPEVMRALETYSWPGNIRELENVIERAFTFAKGKYIELHDLPSHFNKPDLAKYNFNDMSLKQVKRKAIQKIERDYLVFLLKKYQGNVTKIAEESATTRRNTYRLLKKYSLKPEDWRLPE
jgi:DNA-binding NtrC family response regulator